MKEKRKNTPPILEANRRDFFRTAGLGVVGGLSLGTANAAARSTTPSIGIAGAKSISGGASRSSIMADSEE